MRMNVEWVWCASNFARGGWEEVANHNKQMMLTGGDGGELRGLRPAQENQS